MKKIAYPILVAMLSLSASATVAMRLTGQSNAPTCVDTDHGVNYAIKGKTQGGLGPTIGATDICGSDGFLYEFYCSPENRIKYKQYPCPTGCIDGACTRAPGCGNGTVESDEQCDDGNSIDVDGCSILCKVGAVQRAYMSVDSNRDGAVTWPEYAETYGNLIRSFGSKSSTHLDFNEDGQVDLTELGPLNLIAKTHFSCGNGRIEAEDGEVCDDGNQKSGDGCSAFCQLEFEGGACQIDADCTVDQFCAERCKGDGNCDMECIPNNRTLCANDTNCASDEICSERCASDGSCARECVQGSRNNCGNGRIDAPSEECDDGNFASYDGCSATCKIDAQERAFLFLDTQVDGRLNYWESFTGFRRFLQAMEVQNLQADFDQNGKVDDFDLQLFKRILDRLYGPTQANNLHSSPTTL